MTCRFFSKHSIYCRFFCPTRDECDEELCPIAITKMKEAIPNDNVY